MAWLFVLGAECGPRREDAAAVAAHFAGLTWALSGGAQSSTSPPGKEWLVQGDRGDWWAVVCPSGLSHSGAGGNPDEARRMTEVGNHLYARLRTAPAFRFAMVGVEAYDWSTADGLSELIRRRGLNSGLVLSDALWDEFHRPPHFVPFAPGYRWSPYVGQHCGAT